MEEHVKSVKKGDQKSALSQHQEQSGPLKILDSEQRDRHRKVKAAMHIKLQGVSLNRNYGHHLPDIYLQLLCQEEVGTQD